jgi:hypothetical protein
MVTSQLSQVPALMNGGFGRQRELWSCDRQVAAAEKELGAFVSAILILYGREAVDYAAECWVELVERSNQPLVEGSLSWRQISIAAASLLAEDFWLLCQ